MVNSGLYKLKVE